MIFEMFCTLGFSKMAIKCHFTATLNYVPTLPWEMYKNRKFSGQVKINVGISTDTDAVRTH